MARLVDELLLVSRWRSARRIRNSLRRLSLRRSRLPAAHSRFAERDARRAAIRQPARSNPLARTERAPFLGRAYLRRRAAVTRIRLSRSRRHRALVPYPTANLKWKKRKTRRITRNAGSLAAFSASVSPAFSPTGATKPPPQSFPHSLPASARRPTRSASLKAFPTAFRVSQN